MQWHEKIAKNDQAKQQAKIPPPVFALTAETVPRKAKVAIKILSAWFGRQNDVAILRISQDILQRGCTVTPCRRYSGTIATWAVANSTQ